MKFEDLKYFLTLWLPIAIIALATGFVKVVFIRKEESAFVKIMKFFASVVFGVMCGYIAASYFKDEKYQWVVYAITGFTVLLADQITNKIDKTGLSEILDYVKTKTNTPTKKDNSEPNG